MNFHHSQAQLPHIPLPVIQYDKAYLVVIFNDSGIVIECVRKLVYFVFIRPMLQYW